MSRLIESIRIENAEIQNWRYHHARMEESGRVLWGSSFNVPEISDIETVLPKLEKDLIYKLRILYDLNSMEYSIKIYQIKEINTLKVVYSNTISYNLKYEDRSGLEGLFGQKGDADDIIIARNGWVTDSYYCNVALLGENGWVTPAMPLLKGTARQRLIDTQIITESDIAVDDIHRFKSICLFNAMIPFGCLVVDTKRIFL